MFKRMGLGLFRGNKLGYGLSCTDHLAFHGEKTGKNRMMVIFWYFNGSGVCGSAVTPRQMILPSTSIPGFTFSTDGNHKDKQDVGFSLSYRYRAVFVMLSLWLLLSFQDVEGHRLPGSAVLQISKCSLAAGLIVFNIILSVNWFV